MTNLNIIDSKSRIINIESYDDLDFIITFENKKIGEFNLENSEEDDTYIQFMNIFNDDFENCGIGTQVLEILVEIYGRDIHQPFEKYRFHDVSLGLPRVDSESEKFIEKAINANILNKYKSFHSEYYND
ncbi:hypothetical protein [Acinetobacter nosocomialis]|uniref:hypothetical protein n=1 Tax=Acinetobacter nosocomialis TaxID=106654 RepID=UPI00396C8DA2